MVRTILSSFLVLGLSCSTNAQINVNSSEAITFKIKNFGVTITGFMSGLEGEIKFDSQDLSTARFDVSLDASSVTTGISLRDNHLKRVEYLDVKNYPRIKFVSMYVVKGGKPNTWVLTGELTIKKITKKISFPFTISSNDHSNNFKGEFRINRRDFGVGGKSISLADELVVLLNVRS